MISPEPLKFNPIFEDVNISESSSDSDIEASSLREVIVSPTKALSPRKMRTEQKKTDIREEGQDELGHYEDSHSVAEEEGSDLQYEATTKAEWCCKCKYSCVCKESTCNQMLKCLWRKRVHVIAYGTLVLLLVCALFYLCSLDTPIRQVRSTIVSYQTKHLRNIERQESKTEISRKALTEVKQSV